MRGSQYAPLKIFLFVDHNTQNADREREFVKGRLTLRGSQYAPLKIFVFVGNRFKVCSDHDTQNAQNTDKEREYLEGRIATLRINAHRLEVLEQETEDAVQVDILKKSAL